MAYRKSETAGRLVDEAAGTLKDRIRSGAFAPGQRLIVADLETDLGVSAGPLREALRKLAGEGLVEIEPHRGATVRRLGPAETAEVYEIREALEGMAARLAARSATPESLARLAAALEASDRAAAEGNLSAYVRANEAFHGAIHAIAARPRLREMADRLSLMIDRLSVRRLADPVLMRAAAAEHRVVAAAIRAGDPDAAEAAMRTHVRNSGLAVLADASRI